MGKYAGFDTDALAYIYSVIQLANPDPFASLPEDVRRDVAELKAELDSRRATS